MPVPVPPGLSAGRPVSRRPTRSCLQDLAAPGQAKGQQPASHTRGLHAHVGEPAGLTTAWTCVLIGQDTFDLYSNLANTWASAGNVLGTDFNMYSTYADAQAGVNGWQSCNFDDSGVGYPRDCGRGHTAPSPPPQQ